MLAILSKAKTEEERHFYISLCVKENYSVRELSRQIDSAYYERSEEQREAKRDRLQKQILASKAINDSPTY